MSSAATRTAPARRRAPDALPRVLAAYRADASVGLDEHLSVYGPPPWRGAARRGGPLVNTIESSGLRGRGGASFPTGRKLRAVAEHRGRAVMIANGAEGEPLSAKDRLLLTGVPHLVLDGASLAAEAVGADEVIIAVDRSDRQALATLNGAIAARRAAGLEAAPVRLVALPTRYVAGEESALVQFVNGGVAKPTFTPPRPFERGVAGRPTLIQNVETLAHVALIARFGAEWFRELGTDEEPGSTLVTVSGAVRHASVCEVALGTPLHAALDAVGGPAAELSAFLVGGYFGSWLPARQAWDVPLTNAALRNAGGALGTGVIYAFPAEACGLVATARVAEYLAGETAGQCGPCVHGLRAIADAMTGIAAGRHVTANVARLHELFAAVQGRGACHYPDGVIRFVATALDTFDDEIRRHHTHHRCLRGEPPVLATRSDGTWQ